METGSGWAAPPAWRSRIGVLQPGQRRAGEVLLELRRVRRIGCLGLGGDRLIAGGDVASSGDAWASGRGLRGRRGRVGVAARLGGGRVEVFDRGRIAAVVVVTATGREGPEGEQPTGRERERVGGSSHSAVLLLSDTQHPTPSARRAMSNQ